MITSALVKYVGRWCWYPGWQLPGRLWNLSLRHSRFRHSKVFMSWSAGLLNGSSLPSSSLLIINSIIIVIIFIIIIIILLIMYIRMLILTISRCRLEFLPAMCCVNKMLKTTRLDGIFFPRPCFTCKKKTSGPQRIRQDDPGDGGHERKNNEVQENHQTP